MTGGRGSIQLARIFGIRIGVTTSWFVVLFFFIFILSGQFRDVLDSSNGVAYLTAVASALLFFCSLVAHELGHALVGRRLGIETSGIDLWFFGGIAKMDRDADSAGTEFKVAAAGPAVTLAIVGLCVLIGVLTAGWHRFWDAVVLHRNVHVSPALLLLSWLAAINAAVFAFNLVPAFPLDGDDGVVAYAAHDYLVSFKLLNPGCCRSPSSGGSPRSGRRSHPLRTPGRKPWIVARRCRRSIG